MAGIIAIEYYVPEYKITNEQLVEEFQTWTAEKIYKKTGIKSRSIAAESETAVDLGFQAAEKLLNNLCIDRNDIDFLIFVTESPDYILPPSACILHQKLGLRKTTGAVDVNMGCSGYIYGLALSKGLIDSKIAKNILLITADTYSKYVNKQDRSTRTIFGDGAAATLISTTGKYIIGEFDLCTDGSGNDLLQIPAGGARIPRTQETEKEENVDGNIRSKNNLYMDGPGVFGFTAREVPSSIERLFSRVGLTIDDIDLFIFHQANGFMLDYLRRTMRIDPAKFIINMEDIGNTVSASIPIAMKKAMIDNKIEGKKRILLSGFGVGLSWGSTIIYSNE